MADLISNIVAKVKRRAQIPDNQVAYTSADLLAFIQEEMEETVLPWLYGINENFGLVKEYVQFRDSSNNLLYPLGIIPWPTRAFGRNLKEIKWYDEQDNPYNIPWLDIEDEDLVSKNTVRYPLQRAVVGFSIISDGIRIYGDPTTFTGSIELTYPVKSPILVNSSTLTVGITAMNYSSGTTTFTVDNNTATDFNSAVPAATTTLVDIFRKSTGAPIFTNVAIVRTGDACSTAYLSNDEFNSLAGFQEGGFLNPGNTLTTGYTADLYLAPAGQSNRTQLPPEIDQLLILAVVDRYLEAQGDTEGLAVNAEKMKKSQQNLLKLFGKRVSGEAKAVVNRRGIRAWSTFTWPRRW